MLKLKKESLDWSLKHIEEHGDTDIFPVPFEYKAIRYLWDQKTKELPSGTTFRENLSSQDVLSWKVGELRKYLTPKHKYGFRQATQLDPLDNLIYLSLIYEIGEDIESARIPIDDKVSFSYRFAPDESGRMFNPDVNYGSFLEYCKEKVSEIEGHENIKYIVVADIADFFPRIYLHPLENALSSCTTKTNHVKAIKKLLNNWNYSISYGIPVGQNPSRLLGELALNDIDQGLVGEGVDFCRYVDDFRIFCKSEKEAYQNLALLAEMLFENHGLTLQQHKTQIVSVENFKAQYLKSRESVQIERLSDAFIDVLDSIGIEDMYGEVHYEDLPEDFQEQIDRLNLLEILLEQIESEESDSRVVGFVLKRMAQLQKTDAVDIVIDNIDKLYTSFKHIMNYLKTIELNRSEKKRISTLLLKVLDDSIVGHLDYHRMLIFEIFSTSEEWCPDNVVALYNEYTDDLSRRKLILSLGEAENQSWFKTRKRNVMNFPSWQRRAFLTAGKCLPGDEASHWYRSLLPRLNELEIAVVKWSLK